MTKPYVPLLKEQNTRRGFFSQVEFGRLKALLPSPVDAIVTFAHITGWRVPSEILSLQWRQVDFDGGQVCLDPGTTKNDQARVFPFTRELQEILEQQKAVTKELQRTNRVLCPWVFHRNGHRVKGFSRSWKTATRKAGIPGRIPHDLRRTAVRNLVRAGVPERVAMTLTGHKTRAVFERYNIVSESDLLEAAARLDVATWK